MRTSELRWFLKKSARKTVAMASEVGAVLPLGSDAPTIRVLTYHRFGDTQHDAFCVSVAAFDRQMATLANLGLAVPLARVEAFLDGTDSLANGSVLVTIDDGCPSVLAHAIPILRRHSVPAVVFVPAGEISEQTKRRTSTSEDAEDRMSWAELERVADAGLTVGSHAWTHESLGRMPLAAVREQTARSRETIERRLGRPVTALAYPFGTRADFNAGTGDAVRDAGYRCAFTSQHGGIRSDANRFVLPRIKVEGGEDLWMFEAAIRGGLDAWRWIDRTLWRVQASGGQG
jgi:peptidoglycan/xylan/chitin deacetylase (PgdA/CDA1 family)